MRCPSCSGEADDGSRFCPACGESLLATATRETSGTTASAGIGGAFAERVRFLPGTILDGRYRIVGLLGRGGMGEVYRADDLKLGQAVALKFLPRDVEGNPKRLTRFLNEVRLARQVSHPAVCRVHDVGEVERQHYISMEYVDGENLASLLRRVGRLPGDRAVQVARQLCSGLAAAHEQGILHRDLKPANVMIDGRGRAKITDFGLAGLAGGIEGAELRSGTPQYMAPEQLAGIGVSIQSDIYALGLVLYELFTGRRAFEAASLAELKRMHETSTPPTPSSLLEAFDPAVEGVILRCLERRPEDRPASALAVAVALPGGDPLAAALAAGETPPPDVVAAAGPEGGLRPGVAVACLAAVIAGTLAYALANEGGVYDRFPMVKSAEALGENARAIARDLGYPEPPRDRAAGFFLDYPEFLQLSREQGPKAAWERLGEPGQMVLRFFYRQAPGRLVPLGIDGAVDRRDPPPKAGDVTMILDLQGRLSYLRVVPESVGPREPTPPIDWSPLFAAAGLDPDSFESTTPMVRPEVFAQARAAWRGVLTDNAARPVRIEAAACDGRPVYFEKVVSSNAKWQSAEQAGPVDNLAVIFAASMFLVALLVGVIIGALILAMRNLRLGRGDRRGALRIATLVVGLRLLHWLLTGHHVVGIEELGLLIVALMGALSLGLFWYVGYVALEPYLRRLRPQALVAWSRMLAGRLRDPLVGRDILIGQAAWIGMLLALIVVYTVGASLGFLAPMPDGAPLMVLRGGRHAVGELARVLLVNGQTALLYAMFFLLCRIVFRRAWLAGLAFVAILGALFGLPLSGMAPGHVSAGAIVMSVLWGAVLAGGFLFVLTRFGLLALVSAAVMSGLLTTYPIMLRPSAPHFASFLLGPLVGIALAIWAFRLSLGGRQVFSDDALEGRAG